MYTSIVVGTDGSDTASEAVRQASELARRDGARLHVVSATGSPNAMELAGMAQFGPAPDDGVAAAASVLADTCSTLESRGVEAESWAQRGDAADAILRIAEQQHADLIVVGDRGMHGKRRFVLGSVPNRVSHRASCSVLIVHTT